MNVAARVEGITGETGDPVLLTEATRCLLERPEAVVLSQRGAIPLKGKRDPVPIYAASVLDERPTPATTGLIAEA